jgi:hypothetical protein
MMLTCPATGQDFSTGIDIDEHSFMVLPDVENKSQCPHCEAIHAWRTHEARWYDVIGPSLWVDAHRRDGK